MKNENNQNVLKFNITCDRETKMKTEKQWQDSHPPWVFVEGMDRST